MRKFNTEQACRVIELEQLMVDYWREVDENNGLSAVEFFAEDVVGDFGAITFHGHDGVRKYYADRLNKIHDMQKDGVRTTRHICQNLRICFEEEQIARLSFQVVTYARGGHPPVPGATTPVAISDARLSCRLDDDGQWRIFEFFGSPIFLGEEEFAKSSLTGK